MVDDLSSKQGFVNVQDCQLFFPLLVCRIIYIMLNRMTE